MADPTYNFVPTDPVGQMRLLVNDVAAPWVFSDEEITAFLAIEGQNIKMAAAQAIDTNADNELLASKVLTTQDLQTDGSKIAQALHARAASLRAQAISDEQADGYFDIVDTVADHRWDRDELDELPAQSEWQLGWLP